MFIELVHYLVTLLKVRVRKSRALFGHFIKIPTFLGIRALLGLLTLSQSPKRSRITWPLYKNSYTPKYSRITWPLFSDQISLISRITRLICIFTSSDVHWTRALLGHLTQSQSPEISCITWPLYKNSYTPRNSRITWPPYLNKTSLISRITRLICIYTSSDVHWTRALLGHLTPSQSPEISRIIWSLYKNLSDECYLWAYGIFWAWKQCSQNVDVNGPHYWTVWILTQPNAACGCVPTF